MPQQPASRSTTVAPGIRDSSAFAGGSSAHRLLMAVAVEHDRSPAAPRSVADAAILVAAAARGTPRTAPTARRPPARLALRVAPRAAPGRLRAWPTGSSARRTRTARPLRRSGYSRSVLACARGACLVEQPCEISGRPQQPFGARPQPEARCLEALRRPPCRPADCSSW